MLDKSSHILFGPVEGESGIRFDTDMREENGKTYVTLSELSAVNVPSSSQVPAHGEEMLSFPDAMQSEK